jgi:hypothetical protein
MNMIIKSECEANVEDDHPFDFQGPLAQVNDAPAEFFAFLATQQEIRNWDEHNRVHQDLMEHLWTQRGNAQ